MKSKIITVIFAIVMFSACAVCIIKPADEYSESERRMLKSMPELNIDTVFSGEFAEEFEGYTTDQFPLRDTLRSLKANFAMNVLKKLDNNGLFVAEGHISKIDAPENEYMINYASRLFEGIVKKYMTDKNTNVYFSIVPDKNFVLAENNGYPSMDYDAFIEKMKSKTEFMEYIDITPYLSLDDYYKTDTHWRQEKITDVAKMLAEKMGSSITTNYWENTLNNPFYGVYAGQSALMAEPDEIICLTNEIIDNCTVTYYGSGMGKMGAMYDKDKAYGKDPYEMFLSGSEPLITIENPMAENDKELVIFRDSYGSSLAPLLAQGYKKTTVIDIRYMKSDYIGNFVGFNNCDVLFIYSTAVLNASTSMK